MKLFTGWVMSAGLVLAATSANAQMLAPYQIGGPRYSAVSDFDGPYAEMPPEVPAPRYGPMLLPAPEVYTVVRENGFSPLGIPRQRGFVYTISVINRDGDDGQLVIDARNGRIIRFVPAYRMGDNINRDTEHDLWSGRAVATGEPGQGRAAAAGADPAAGEPHARRCRCPARCRRMPASRGRWRRRPRRHRPAICGNPAKAARSRPGSVNRGCRCHRGASLRRRRSGRRRRCRRCRIWSDQSLPRRTALAKKTPRFPGASSSRQLLIAEIGTAFRRRPSRPRRRRPAGLSHRK